MLLGAAALLGCSGAAPAVEPSEYAGRPPLNPRAADGRPVYLGYGHHPDCFVLGGAEGDASRDTIKVECSDGALRMLAACPSGLLYESARGGCVCVPAGGDDPSRVDCPASVAASPAP